jgi:outer membrane receptor protein involved in Fe transport
MAVACGAAALMLVSLDGAAFAQAPAPAETPAPAQTPSAPAAPAPAATPAPAPSSGPTPGNSANAPGTELPEVTVEAPKRTTAPSKPKQRVAGRPAPSRAASRTAASTTTPATLSPEAAAAAQVASKNAVFDQARSNIYTTIGVASDAISHETIADLPQGANAPLEKVMLQLPGVSQDSAASGLVHIRNDHANVQYRINGVMLPDGVTGFGSVLDTSLVGNMSLLVGALPAEFGMRTVGVIDLTTRNDAFNNSGSISLYGGSHGTITPSIEYGGTFGGNCAANTATTGYYKAPSYADCFPGVQYFFTGSYLQNTVGIENPTPNYNAIHDFTQQEKGFAFMSAVVDPTTRVSLIAGTAVNAFQIPNNPGQPTSGLVPSAFGITNFDSSLLNENQYEVTHYGVLSVQTSKDGLDTQLSYFTRYNNLHFWPDPVDDLLINGISSNVLRNSQTNGIQGDASYQLNSSHTIRGGFTVSGEQVFVGNTSLVEPCMVCDGTDSVDMPTAITDNVSKTGWLMGVYAQDEWKVTNQFTINAGLRFDQMDQFVDANQLSPRLSFTYKPVENTTFHAGYARYFTPPVLVEAAPANIGLFNNTTGAVPTNQGNDPVLPERSNYFDAGVDQKIPLGCSSPNRKDCTNLELGFDAYYKVATDLIDNGQFGQALVLSAFNYAQGINDGVEFHAKYNNNYLQAYANLAIAQQKATDPVSNQYLFGNTPLADLGGLTQFQYLQTHWVYTDHNQFVTASAGAVYTLCGRPVSPAEAYGVQGISWCGTKLSADMIYGSGLRNGDANTSTVPAYTQVNVGIKRDFYLPNDPLPMTVRFDVVNLFDTIYLIRDGSGIGVFAPQYGPRRGFFLGLSKKIGTPDSAFPADHPARPFYKAPPIVASSHDWSGFYTGLNAGGGASHNCWTNTGMFGVPTVPDGPEGCHDAVGLMIGGQAGYRWQSANLVFGVEGKGDWANLAGSNLSQFLIAPQITNQTKIDAMGLITGQIGYSWNNVLGYVKGGAAVTHNTYGGYLTATNTIVDEAAGARWGGTIGTGLEIGFAPNWSVALEYDHLFMGTSTPNLTAAGVISRTESIQQNADIATASINYRWGGL